MSDKWCDVHEVWADACEDLHERELAAARAEVEKWQGMAATWERFAETQRARAQKAEAEVESLRERVKELEGAMESISYSPFLGEGSDVYALTVAREALGTFKDDGLGQEVVRHHMAAWLERLTASALSTPSERPRGDLSKLLGKWPGDETDEQVEAAMAERRPEPAVERVD